MSDNGTAENASSSREKRRRRSRKGESRREELVQAAIKVFGRVGYQSAPIATIADEVGLSLPGLLHHFPSKADLLLAVLERREADVARQYRGQEDGNWRNMLDLLCAINKTTSDTHGIVKAFTLLNSESLSSDHLAKDWFLRRQNRIRGMLRSALAKGVEKGELHSYVNPDVVALHLLAVMDGLQIQWLRAPERVNLVDAFDQFVKGVSLWIERKRT